MKTKSILLGIALISTVLVNAQQRGNGKQHTNNGNQKEVKKQTPQKQQPRTVTVEREPQRTVNHVNRNTVNYKKEKPKVVVYRDNRLPQMKSITYNNRDYYYDRGLFYKKHNNNFVKIAPPIGFRLNFLPNGYITVHIGNRNVFYYEGVYYSPYNDYYEVINPPIGAIVYALPADYEKVVLNGVMYYEYNGVLYEKIHYYGERAYQVVGYLD